MDHFLTSQKEINESADRLRESFTFTSHVYGDHREFEVSGGKPLKGFLSCWLPWKPNLKVGQNEKLFSFNGETQRTFGKLPLLLEYSR